MPILPVRHRQLIPRIPAQVIAVQQRMMMVALKSNVRMKALEDSFLD
jgi:hypothetical protein